MKPEKSPLKLKVSNFGPISEAHLELRPLTVFVGPSNTGKSYLSILIYALHKHFTNTTNTINTRSWISSEYFPRRVGSFYRKNRKLSKSDFEDLKNLAKCISAEDNGSESIKKRFSLSAPIVELIRSNISSRCRYLEDEIMRCFGLEEVKDLIRDRKEKSFNINIHKNLNDLTYIQHQLNVGKDQASFQHFETIISADLELEIIIDNKQFDHHEKRRRFSRLMSDISLMELENDKIQKDITILSFLDALVDYIFPEIIDPLSCPAFYLPADRTGMMHAHSLVVSSLIDRAPMAGILSATHQPILSGVLADFLGQLVQLGSYNFNFGRSRLQNENMEKHATQIEKAILSGFVETENSEASSYPRFSYKPEGWKDHSLPLMNASSMASELAPVVLYLRHLVRPGNVLIVEEPEAHLHPELQVEFTRQLASLVQSGVRVVVTTHSDWLLNELANIVRRSEIVTEQEESSTDNISLRPDQVGAWLFRKTEKSKGSIVKELILDDEAGLYPTDYDTVSEALYNESMVISRHIQRKIK